MEQDKDKITFKEEYFENGKLKYKWRYLNGEYHGEQLGYFSDGEIMYKLYYINGKKHGEQLKYWVNGKLFSKSHYINSNYVTYEEWIKYIRNQKLQSIWNKIK